MGGIPWTKEEDELLRKCIEKYGEAKWHRVPLLAGLNRCRKSCRLRWLNYLRPDIKRGTFAEEEVDLIIKLHKLLGNRWSLVAARLPGRTGNDVKNYWNCHLSKRLNAQETDHQEKHYARNNVQVIRPQSSISSAAGTSSKTKPSTSWQLPAVVVQEESSSTSMPMLCNIEDGQSTHQMFETDHYNKNNVPCVDDQEHGIMGDLAMDHQFEQVTDQYHDQEVNNKWDWDDSILDMDLWTDS